MHRRLAWVLCAATLAMPAAPPQPDLTGEWRALGAAAGRVMEIDHRDPVLILRVAGDPAALFYSTDGVERVNGAVKTRTRWDGAALELRTESAVDRYELTAPDRLTVKRTAEGRAEEVVAYERVPLRAGVGRAELTPRVPMAMYGYANRRCGPLSTGTHDALWAKAVILDSARGRVGIVTLDLGSVVVSARLRERAALELGLDVLLAAASHTHSGPAFLPPSATGAAAEAYYAQAEAAIFAALQQARSTLAPARLRIGRGEARLGYNRLTPREHGRSRAAFDNPERLPHGPLDPEFQLLEVTTPAGEPRALLMHYAVHAVVLGPTNCEISADYPGVLQANVEAALPGVQAMFVQGGAGDINPLFMGRKGDAAEDFGQVKKMGDLLSAEVLKARSAMRAATGTVVRATAGTLRLADRWEPSRAPHEVGLATVLIGRDIAIAATPGEPLHRLQTKWKAEADVEFPLFYGYTHSGVGVWPGYIPDLRSAAYGGYGAGASTRVETGAGEAIVERHRRDLFGLRGLWLPQMGQN
ncbi:MAG: neutral/alkaline non-lysosomal ceramidase N-terminal domain-containing protein [Bryobacterales bacterium]|nr:neutral/alkaline non-lysosomal ceramidase N-terminal domain-containing protein [Bryobacterales bacterium]